MVSGRFSWGERTISDRLWQLATSWTGIPDPWPAAGLFLAASLLMIWRLGRLEEKGFEGTILGTLIMPYCSGFSNLVFAFVMGNTGGSGSAVLENCLVNNVTNLTLLLGLPVLLTRIDLLPSRGRRSVRRRVVERTNLLSLLLNLIALCFFSGVVWALARDGTLGQSDGLVLVGLFLFWQVIHLFEVIKRNIIERSVAMGYILLQLLVIAVAAAGQFISIEHLVEWISSSGSGWLSYQYIGWLSGALMVLPNGLLALYYAIRQRPEIVISSQIGDAHICIPMCVGLYALFSPIRVPHFIHTGALVLVVSGAAYFIALTALGRLPRWTGALALIAYAGFLYHGLA
jgi:cation:H+ antiporter